MEKNYYLLLSNSEYSVWVGIKNKAYLKSLISYGVTGSISTTILPWGEEEHIFFYPVKKINLTYFDKWELVDLWRWKNSLWSRKGFFYKEKNGSYSEPLLLSMLSGQVEDYKKEYSRISHKEYESTWYSKDPEAYAKKLQETKTWLVNSQAISEFFTN